MKTHNQLLAGILMMASLAGAACTAITADVDCLLKTVNEAKASNNKGKTKTALEAASKHLVDMKQHADDCMNHMNSMESMETTMLMETK